MSDRIMIESIPDFPRIEQGHDIGRIIVEHAQRAGIEFQENDILCVASKAVSTAEGRVISLDDIEVSDVAAEVHKKIPRKDPRAIQVIINETGALDGSRLELDDNYIAGWLPNGMRLTSSGVDKHGIEQVIVLPVDSDASARAIGETVLAATGVNVGVVITDSDGRVEKRGSTQLAIGLYGVPGLRISSVEQDGKVKIAEESIADLIAGSAALLMGQRGTNKPVVLVRGFDYEFDKQSSIIDSLSRPGTPK
ncbi:MAG: coenzyme F420-0:L-glutamate ligase [Candidatus Saccharibacteria bacterium]|nr:coenzyme F420-0:L-glutamate ligase [Candidatus Saccharibacteria bacterium]